MRRKLAAIALAIGVITVFAGSALAGHLAAGVTSYTGCLVSKDGVIIKIKAGESPSSPCSGGMVQVHFSGGDITGIAVGEGLTGGGTNGTVTIGLDASFTLPQGCSAGDIVERTPTGWTCGTDDDTTYAAGTGLDLSAGNVFSIEPDNRVSNDVACSAGAFVKGINSLGVIECATPPTPPAAPIRAYATGLAANFDLGGTETVLTLNAPAGNYLLFAAVDLQNIDHDSPSMARCAIPNYTSDDIDIRSGTDESISLMSALTHPGGAINLTCTELNADIDVFQASLQAIRVDTVN